MLFWLPLQKYMENKNLANLKGKVTDLSFETFENFKKAHLADHLYSYIRNKK